MSLPSLYTEHASWFHLLTHPDDYEEEAAAYLNLLSDAAARPIESLLEMGSGGGNNAFWYSRHVPNVTLSDLSQGMLDLSQTINPNCTHVQGDMRSLRLGRTFDAVFIHDAIVYLTTEADLAACFETAAAHLQPGGLALFVPDAVRETFTPSTKHGGHDSPDGSRGLRYLEWSWDADPSDSVYQTEYAYILRDGNEVRAAHDHHDEGVFARSTWTGLLERAGFEVVDIRQMEWDGELESQTAFLARKR
ncbi:MAG: class I SAM-dependent methyltransferase [Dehalococcoidia bacterium]